MEKLKQFTPLIIGILITLTVIYSSFWFYQTYSIKKQINNFVKQHDEITFEKITSHNFPFKPNFTITNLIFKNPQAPITSNLETKISEIILTKTIFSKNFSATITDKLSVNFPNNIQGQITFNEQPKINFSTNENIIDISYYDNGYKINDSNNATIYQAGSSKITLKIDQNQTPNLVKINSSLKEFELMPVFSTGNNKFAKSINNLDLIAQFGSDDDTNFKIDKLDFSNQFYKINANAQAQKDRLTVKLQIKDIDNLTSHIQIILQGYIDKLKLLISSNQGFTQGNAEEETQIDQVNNLIKSIANIKKKIPTIITNIAKQNQETNKQTSIFDIEFYGPLNATINQTKLTDVLEQLNNETP